MYFKKEEWISLLVKTLISISPRDCKMKDYTEYQLITNKDESWTLIMP